MKYAADSSVLIPALSPWHAAHQESLDALQTVEMVPAHALIETFSVMTRIGGNLRTSPEIASEVLTDQPWEVVQLPAEEYAALLTRVTAAGRPGGAVFDAVIGATAAHHGAVLLSRDARALATYDAVGVSCVFV